MSTDLILPYSNPYVSGRTMDSNGVLNSKICKIPVGYQFTSKSPTGAGKSWTGTEGFVAMNFCEAAMYCDGMNTAGLSVGAMELKETVYHQPTAAEASKCVAITDAVAYFLSTCTTVESVRQALDDIVLWGNVEPGLGADAPKVHLVAHDRQGKTLVIEIINGANVCYQYRSVYGQDIWKDDSNPTSVLTYEPSGMLSNSPPFDQQLPLFKTVKDECDNALKTFKFPIPCPGGPSSEDRFQRGGFFRSLIPEKLPPEHRRYSNPAPLKQQRVQFVIQLLNRVEITEMEIRESKIDLYTVWSVVRDHTNGVYYYYDNMNHNLRAIDLEKLTFDNGKSDEVSVSAGDWSSNFTITLSR